MNESDRSWTWGRLGDVTSRPEVVVVMSCLRPLSLSNDKGEEACGEVGDCIGVESGEDEAESDVLSLVVKVRKMGIVDIFVGCWFGLAVVECKSIFVMSSCRQATCKSGFVFRTCACIEGTV